MKWKYILKRILIAIPTFFGITILAYFILNMAPGSPLDALLADPGITPAELERKRVALGLDQPVIIQYFTWLKQLLTGNLGFSYSTQRPVAAMILERLPATAILAASSIVLSLIVSIPLGIFAASRPNSGRDYFSGGLSMLMMATPNFFVGLVFIYLFAIVFNILPSGGMYSSSGAHTFGDLMKHMILPCLVLSFQQIGGWFIDIAFREVFSSKILITELIGVILFSAVFSNISSSFQPYGVSDSGFFVTYLITFSIIFTNFTAMTTLFENTVILLSSFLKVLLPVYTLAVSLSGNLSTGVVFYEYFIIVVLLLNWICIKIFLPLLQYYLLLELLNRFSKKQNISRLCEGLFLFLSKGVQVLFFLFFGFHLLETMIAPSFDAAKNNVLNKMIGLIPGAGCVTGTVLGSSLVIKNALGAAGIVFLFLFLLLPLTKLLCYVFFYFLLSVVLEPVADERFVECISAAVKCGLLLIKVLCMSSVLFIVIIALTTLTTNHIG